MKRVSIMCVIREMAKSLFSGSIVATKILCFSAAIIGIPLAVIYGVGALIALYGEKVRDIVGITFLLCVAAFVLFSAIREWYLDAKDKCEMRNNA